MRRLGRHNGDAPGREHLLLAGDGEGYLTRNDVPNLFLLVLMLVQWCGTSFDVVMSERHVRRMEEPPTPPRKWITGQHFGGSDEGHDQELMLACQLLAARWWAGSSSRI
jgi:hypothetical protein